MTPNKYDRNVYGITPPLEDEDPAPSSRPQQSETSNNKADKLRAPTTTSLDPENIHNMATLLKARLQYAQIKITTGLSSENLQQLEHAFISSPRQPRRPLPSEYPPTPAHSIPGSRKIRRMLLSAMTPTQNSWRKKKRIREQRKNEAIEDEAAARTILMLSSQQHPPILTPPNSGRRPHKSNFDRSTPAYYDDHENAPNMYDAVADISNYDEQSREIGRSLPKRQPHIVPPPPAIIHSQDEETGSPRQYYQYDRPLPPPPQYFYKQPSMSDRSLPEDPFQSKPVIRSHLPHSRDPSPPSP